jgi:hypothetical protein
MESEETGEENRGTSEKDGQRRRSSGKQKQKNDVKALHLYFSAASLCSYPLVFVPYYYRLTAVIHRSGNEF